jgi:hypothetical protein
VDEDEISNTTVSPAVLRHIYAAQLAFIELIVSCFTSLL